MSYLDQGCQCWMPPHPRPSFGSFTILYQHIQQHNRTITGSKKEQQSFKYRVSDGLVGTRIQEDDGAFLLSIYGCIMQSSPPLNHTHNRHQNTNTRDWTQIIFTLVLWALTWAPLRSRALSMPGYPWYADRWRHVIPFSP